MAKIALTEGEVDRIMAEPKRLSKDVEWHYNQNESYVKCELDVENHLKINLKMYINVNIEDPSLHTFSLVLSNAYCIRRLDVNTSHKNRHTNSNLWQGKSHKHIWTDNCRDSYAYTPDDPFNDNINENFKLFCQECNIEFTGGIKPLPPKQLTFKEME